MTIRVFRQSDRGPVLDLLDRTGMFTPDEVDVAAELIDVFLHREGQKDYLLLTVELHGTVAGYVCYGPTAATEGTWDMYWIAVDPELQGQGIGRALMAATELAIRNAGGQRIVVETSSQEKYEPTRRFYERAGYVKSAQIRDFYRKNDDKIIYMRYFY